MEKMEQANVTGRAELRDNIELLLKLNAREKSDLQTQNVKQLNRIDNLQKKVEEFAETIESLCTVQLCLIES